MPRNHEEQAVAGFDPATRECRFVGWRHPEDVIEALDLGLVLVPVEQAREVFGQPMDRLIAVPRVGRMYLTGPMTGLPEFNYPAFHAEAARLRQLGYHVENPADHSMIDGFEWADYLRLELTKLITCRAGTSPRAPASSTTSPASWACRCSPPARSPNQQAAQHGGAPHPISYSTGQWSTPSWKAERPLRASQ
ncbi:DUF4406 domain-containing protein [Pseudomonas nitritireducens]|nr:DUF4406 domain-containing protein [Pseudomonas nitritireducens]MCE4073268.1 DUF4406 domain-containing protein [Pseudomonas nitritireducens]